MIDFAAARANMVESQVRTSGVTDHRILAAFGAVPREAFVPAERRALAANPTTAGGVRLPGRKTRPRPENRR